MMFDNFSNDYLLLLASKMDESNNPFWLIITLLFVFSIAYGIKCYLGRKDSCIRKLR